MPSQLVKATPGASTATPPGLPKAPPGMMWQETNQQIPTGLMKLTSPGEYGAALRDMNAEWLLKVLQGAPGAVSAGEKALIDKLRAQYTTASGELKLPPDIMNQLRKGVGSAGETVQMEGWQPKGGYSGPSTTTTLNDPRMDKSVPYSEPTAPSIKSPNSYAGPNTYIPKSTMPIQPLGNTGVVIPDFSKMPKPSEGVGFHISSSYDANASPSAIADWEAKMRDLEKRVLAGQVSESVSPAMNVPVSMPSGKANPVTNMAPTSPAGNNIASGAVAPPNLGSAMSGTQISTTAPNTGTIGTDINQSPFSPTAGTRKRTSPNKYFNQRWFGTKQLA